MSSLNEQRKLKTKEQIICMGAPVQAPVEEKGEVSFPAQYSQVKHALSEPSIPAFRREKGRKPETRVRIPAGAPK